MSEYSAALASWQVGALGRAVVAAETQLLAEVCDDVFGLEMLQLGAWGADRELLRGQPRAAPDRDRAAGDGCCSGPTSSPASPDFRSGAAAIDAVVLPHCLEIEPDPGAVLREAERVLVGRGPAHRSSGFRPWSLWGLRAAASRSGYPPGMSRLLSERRLRDWLVLLGFEVSAARHYLLRAARRAAGRRVAHGARHAAAWIFNPLPAGGYLLKARKRVYAPTPLRLRRREHAPLIGSLVKPST